MEGLIRKRRSIFTPLIYGLTGWAMTAANAKVAADKANAVDTDIDRVPEIRYLIQEVNQNIKIMHEMEEILRQLLNEKESAGKESLKQYLVYLANKKITAMKQMESAVHKLLEKEEQEIDNALTQLS